MALRMDKFDKQMLSLQRLVEHKFTSLSSQLNDVKRLLCPDLKKGPNRHMSLPVDTPQRGIRGYTFVLRQADAPEMTPREETGTSTLELGKREVPAAYTTAPAESTATASTPLNRRNSTLPPIDGAEAPLSQQ